MLDVKIMRNDYARVEEALKNRGKSLELISGFQPLDEKRRELLQESESLKNRRNTVSAEVAQRKKNKENADELIAEMREVGDRIKELDEEIRTLEAQIDELMLAIPNIPHASVPVGASEEETSRFAVGASRGHLILLRKPIGTWRPGSAFSILKRRPRSPDRGLLFTRASGRAWSGR
ncbi:hypothetical protein HMSSN036_84480 [Paenibacillus macerans]|nr:hypothetical protein HMSSN036_84480 [Paenibacillus macerans]